MLTYCGLLDWFRPQWFVWENVPGVLSSNGGRDFGSFLGALAELGYGFAYRVFDAQYFGVAQRRRRVFVVGHFGDWRPAAEVLFESESLRGDSPPSREARKETSVFTPSSIGGYREGAGTLQASGGDLGGGSEHLVAQPYEIGNTLTARMHKGMNSDCNESQTPVLQPTYGLAGNTIGRKPENGGNGNGFHEEVSYTLTKADQHGVAHPVAYSFDSLENQGGIGVIQHMAVRRLTPVECERLQGFPDNYTDIKPKGKETPDGPRYKALGNSMAVPCMAWIGQRIQQVENA